MYCHFIVNAKGFFIHSFAELRIGLNDNIVVGKLSQVGYGTHLRVDHAQFHPSVKIDEEQLSKTLSIHPPEGEVSRRYPYTHRRVR